MAQTVRQRMELFLEHINLSQGKFEQKVELANGFVSKIGDSIRRSSLDKIIKIYPELNTIWLLTGAQQMLLSNNNVEAEKQDIQHQLLQELKGIRLSLASMDQVLQSVRDLYKTKGLPESTRLLDSRTNKVQQHLDQAKDNHREKDS